ncbi:unnamed protein product [Rhizophagus irregularis]|uniref:Cytochrome P450 n=1 Tax=Rhizophagus irregularis TaxID=588596 RepID=A0A2I1G8L3_9GLOM|nr:cytochrome P450 [Rhizophagus irregularis]CAB4409936.1 unnamed protein product [Rhizophagus irregularis]
MSYLVIIAVVVILCYLFKQKKLFANPSKRLLISDVQKAKDILNSSGLDSRVKSNQNLGLTFGISNPFTNSDRPYHQDFRKIIVKSIDLNDGEWNRIKNITLKAVNDYSNLDKGGIVEIVPWIQQITLNVVLCGYLGMNVNVDKVINIAPGIINDLWLKSKELNHTKENIEKIMKTKSKLKNLFRSVASEASETPNVIKKISEIARKHFPNVFCSEATNNSLADDLESPLNILIPAYETMWRVVLYSILEIKVRPSLKKDYDNKELNFKEIDDAVKTFLKKPNHSTLKNDSSILWCIIQETLRLYPPTRHIHRVDEKNNTVTIDVEKIHRDPENWGEDATFFKPKRFFNKMNKAHIPFSYGKLKCVAADKFAPTLAAILISAILDRVDDIILGQKTKESLFLKANLPFENNRRAFDKFEVTLTRKS